MSCTKSSVEVIRQSKRSGDSRFAEVGFVRFIPKCRSLPPLLDDLHG